MPDDKKKGMDDIFKLIQTTNKYMEEAGFVSRLVVGEDNFQITEKEVIMKLPFTVTVKIPKEQLCGSDVDISSAVSQAISQAVRVNK
jgi:hypothetical protein